MADYIFYVKVANSKFVLDSVSQATIALGHGITYRFDQSDSSNSGHPLVFSTTSDGTHNSGSAYTTGVTTTGTAGSSGAYVDIAVTSSTPASLYYYCSNHSGMGSAVITTGNTHVTTNNLGLLLPILADATDQWGSHINQSLRKIEDTFGANADVYTYNITGDTTAITGSATAGGTLAFNDGQHIEVYLNGVKLVGNLSSGNDYTLNASTDTITLASNAVNGDVVNVVVFKTFQFADAVPATGGTFTGTVSHSGTLDVSGGTLTTSTAQKTAIVDGGKGNLTKADVGLSNVTNDAQVPASTGGTFSGDVAVTGNVSATGNIQVDDIVEKTSAHGVEIDGVTLKDGGGTFTGDLTVDTNTLKIDSANNRIGIGTSNPDTKLHLIGVQEIQSSTAPVNNNYLKLYHNASASADYGGYFRHFQGDDDSIDAGILLGGSSGSEGRIAFETSGTERLRIDSSGNVGIGEDDPTSPLDVKGDGTTGYPASGVDIPTGRRINLYHGNNDHMIGMGGNGIYFTGNTDIQFSYKNGTNSNNGSSVLKVGMNDGNVTIGDGNLVIGTAGHGIDFSNASDIATGETPTGSVMSDYEEGTFSFDLEGSTSGSFPNSNFSQDSCYYTKIGNMVTCWGHVVVGSSSGSLSGYARFLLPYQKPANHNPVGSVFLNKVNMTNSAKYAVLSPIANTSATYYFYIGQINDDATSTSLLLSSFASGDLLSFTISYKTT